MKHDEIIAIVEQMSKDIVSEYKNTLSDFLEQPEDYNKKTKGQLYYFIGEKTKDINSTNKAINIFKEVLAEEPDNYLIKAFLGSAYALRARDFPMKLITNLTPLGFLRLRYVHQGVRLLDQAVVSDDMNPMIRLIRGVTFKNLPKIFLQNDDGEKDLELLLYWLDNPTANKHYQDLLSESAFVSEAYFSIALFYLKEKKNSKSLFKKVFELDSKNPWSKASAKILRFQ